MKSPTQTCSLITRTRIDGCTVQNSLQRRAVFVFLVFVAISAIAQTAQPGTTAAREIVPGVEAVTHHAENLDVPKQGKPNFVAGKLSFQVETAHWTTIKGTRQFTVPPQAFYIATFMNGTAVVGVNGEERLRHPGEMWTVPAGQSMTVKIQEKRQENVTLDIFSLRPVP